MTMPSKPACADCIFFRPPREIDMGLGQCRVKGPDAIPHPDGFDYTAWPNVSPTDWCGEWTGVKTADDAPLPEPRCGNCNFFERYGPADTGLYVNHAGDCRANPPVHHVDGPFPTVDDKLWCARYQYDPDAEEPEKPAPVPPPRYP